MTNKEGIIIPLSGTRGMGQFAIISTEDEEVTQHRWQLHQGRSGYLDIRRNFWRPGGKYGTLTLAREVWERHHGPAPQGMHVDHQDGNTFDNRTTNLRLATPRQNFQNQQMNKHNTSGMKGVHREKGCSGWYVHICEDRKQNIFGPFSDLETAARFYDIVAIQLFGEFACTNYPREEYPDDL